MKTNRIIIYPKDVQRITGKSEKYGRTLLNKIRQHKKKTKGQLISITEFADYTGLPVDEISSYLKE